MNVELSRLDLDTLVTATFALDEKLRQLMDMTTFGTIGTVMLALMDVKISNAQAREKLMTALHSTPEEGTERS